MNDRPTPEIPKLTKRLVTMPDGRYMVFYEEAQKIDQKASELPLKKTEKNV